jgi:two-component system sensor histidine kinase TctE
VQCAETLNARRELGRDALNTILGLHAFLLSAIACATFVGVDKGLKPLKEVEQKIAQQMPFNLSKIEVIRAPIEIATIVGTINELFRTIETYVLSRARFVTNAAHQLRTPLAGCKAHLELGISQVEDSSAKALLHRANSGLSRMSHLIDKLLILERNEGKGFGAHKSDLVDLNEIIEAASLDLADLAVSSGIDLECITLPLMAQINADREGILELTKNLIENAIRYSNIDGTVTVKLVKKSGISIIVEDDGIGIPESEREFVFERFYRVNTAHGDGCGLGLAIVKEIAQAHDATVSISAGKHGKGTCVEVRFALPSETQSKLGMSSLGDCN